MSASSPSPRPRGTTALAVGLAAVALAGVACAPANSPPQIPVRAGGSLLTQVVDQVQDSGRGASVAISPKGDPAVSYLLATQVLKKGQIPPGIVIGDPQPPAIVVADRVNGIWNRTSVTEQSLAPAEGKAPDLVDKDGHALQGVSTGLAFDAQGKHHVVWSTPGGLYYSDDTGGGYAAPTKIVTSPVTGGSIAVGADGAPWVAFYEGDKVRAAHLVGGSWSTEDVAVGAGPAGAPATVTAVGLGSGGNPLVAYRAGTATVVATNYGGGWTASQVPGAGGLGLSMAIDKAGNAQLAYYDAQGNVYRALSSGATWQVSRLGATAPAAGGSNPSWGTAVALDRGGTRYIAYADTRRKQIVLVTNLGGPFRPTTVPESDGGATPSVALSADGRAIAVAWFDAVNANLDVATNPQGLTLAFPTPPLSQPSGGPPVAQPTGSAPACPPSGTTVTIVAPAGAATTGFEKTCYAGPAGQPFTIQFQNNDPSTPHNVEVFTDSSATQRLGGASGPGDIITGPNSASYKVDALKAGNYYFHCDVHPTTMFGTFAVAKP